MSDKIGKAVQIHLLHFDYYMHEETYAKAETTINLSDFLLNQMKFTAVRWSSCFKSITPLPALPDDSVLFTCSQLKRWGISKRFVKR